jgi:hypothetical protein
MARKCDFCGTFGLCPALNQIPIPAAFKGEDAKVVSRQAMCELSESPKIEEKDNTDI